MVTRILILVTLLIIQINNVSAQIPFITDDASTQGRLKTQIELSYGAGFDNSHRCTSNEMEITPVITFGPHDNVDIVVGIPFIFNSKLENNVLSRVSGFSDLGIEVKYRFFNNKSIALAVKPGLTLPTGNHDSGLGSGKISFSGFFISSLAIKKVNIHCNIGYLRNENVCGAATDIWHVSIGIDYNINDAVHLAINPCVEKNPEKEIKNPLCSGILGLYYCITEHAEIGLGYKYGFTEPETDHSFIAGLTFRF